MATWNWFDTGCKNEWAIFTHCISFTGPFWIFQHWAQQATGNISLRVGSHHLSFGYNYLSGIVSAHRNVDSGHQLLWIWARRVHLHYVPQVWLFFNEKLSLRYLEGKFPEWGVTFGEISLNDLFHHHIDKLPLSIFQIKQSSIFVVP